MAKLIVNGNEKEIKDNGKIDDACEEEGITFGCHDGICGTCIIEVEEGMENLTPKTQAEKDMGLAPNQRLACQCKIKSGAVKVRY